MTWALLLLSVLNARLTPEATAAFDRYVQRAESRMNAEPSWRTDREPRIEQVEAARKVDAPGAMIQDWVGTMFLPGATLDQVQAVLRDYPRYKDFYAPRVIESQEISHKGDDYDVFLRLYEKHILTVVLDTFYDVHYQTPDPKHLLVTSRSTHITEFNEKDVRRHSPDGDPDRVDSGFLWRLNSYWRFEASDGGVYARCEAISLSRNIPTGLGWMLGGFLDSFPKESMTNTLLGTKSAVENHRAK